ncbi:putative reverse transcriptase domain-containing protein [Tanacetum coccineum]
MSCECSGSLNDFSDLDMDCSSYLRISVQETTDKVVLIKEMLKGAIDHQKRKLAPRFVGPFEILERIGPVAYCLRLPQELSSVHDTFHVSNLKKCLADANLHVPLEEIKVDKTHHFVEEPVKIIDCEVNSLKHSRIPIVKVHWNSKKGLEDYMKTKIPPSPDYYLAPEGAAVTSPTRLYPPGYVPESDPEEEPEEDDEDPEEDPVDYPADRDDDDDDDEERDRPEITLPPRKRLGINLGPRYEIGESSATAVTRPIGGHPREAVEEVAPMTLGGVNARVTELTAVQEQDTQDIYDVIEDTQDKQTQIYQSVETLFDDNQYHYETARLLDQEALVSREAWGYSIEVSYMTRLEIMALRSVVMGQQAVISQLQVADRRSLVVTSEMLQGRPPEAVPLTKALKMLKDYRPDGQFQRQLGPSQKVKFSTCTLQGNALTGGIPDDKTTTTVTTPWFEKMESVYSISNCTVACQVKFATCTLQGNALTWWNSHVKTTTPEAAHAMPWRTLKKMMTDKYCPRGEIKKLEFEMWNLKVKGTDVVTYSQRFQELALMCDRMFPEEIDQVEKYVGGLPDTIHGSVMATKPKTMQDAIEFATELMDKKINTWAERQADNKRKSDDTARNNQNQQANKRQNTRRAYAARNGDRRPYEGPRPLCSKCNYHHDGPCAPKCHKCNRFGHLSRDCRNPPNVNTRANQRVCFECGAQGHFKRDCPKLKNNNNRGNRVGNAKAQAKVYAVDNAGENPDNNVVTGTFLLNNRYASILFDTGADRSFVSTAFRSRIVITPTTLDHDYNVELADGRIVGLNGIKFGQCRLVRVAEWITIANLLSPRGRRMLFAEGSKQEEREP